MVKMSQEGLIVAKLPAPVRTSWKVTIYCINVALLILKWNPLYVHTYVLPCGIYLNRKGPWNPWFQIPNSEKVIPSNFRKKTVLYSNPRLE